MDSFEIAYNRALRFLSYRQRSIKEVRDYLLKKPNNKQSKKWQEIDRETVEKVIAKLLNQRFLNDEEFVRMWIESRNRTKPRSQRLLKMELRQKGISDETIESQLRQGPDGQGEIRDQELWKTDLTLAKEIVEKKINKFKHVEIQEIYKKLGGLLARRGFDWETSKRAIDDMVK